MPGFLAPSLLSFRFHVISMTIGVAQKYIKIVFDSNLIVKEKPII
jgi:hypothetical protein